MDRIETPRRRAQVAWSRETARREKRKADGFGCRLYRRRLAQLSYAGLSGRPRRDTFLGLKSLQRRREMGVWTSHDPNVVANAIQSAARAWIDMCFRPAKTWLSMSSERPVASQNCTAS